MVCVRPKGRGIRPASDSTTYKIYVTFYETIHVAIRSSVNSNIIDRKIGAGYTIAEVYQLPRELAARCTSLLALPDTEDELIRHYSLSEIDLSLIRQRRGD